MLECKLHNATYQTTFHFRDGVQAVRSQLSENRTSNTVPILKLVRGPGANGIGAGDCSTLNEDNSGDGYGSPCDFDSSLLPQIAYQSILQAFTTLITGNITLDSTTMGLTDSTAIRSTGLVNSRELYYLTDYAVTTNSTVDSPALQKAIFNSSESGMSGLMKLQQGVSDISLQDALETMFQNFTISLMTSSALQYVISSNVLTFLTSARPNYSSALAPALTNVTHYTAQTVYVYSARKLWLAYGIAAFFTLACVVIGIVVILSSSAYYDNAFSTVLRTTRATELSAEIKREDLNGASPLPGYLKRARVGAVGLSGHVLNTGELKVSEGDVGGKHPTSRTALLNQTSQ